ncbi:MAG TPA: hypothetical protein VF920_14725 [Dongiaceae bacterium]
MTIQTRIVTFLALLGASLFTVMQPSAWAAEDCLAAVKQVREQAAQLNDAAKQQKIEKLLKLAEDEVKTEQDPEECLDYVKDAQKLLKK